MGDGISIQTTLNQATKVARVQQGQQTSPEGEEAFARELAENGETDIQAIKANQEAKKAKLRERRRRRRRRRRKKKSSGQGSQEKGQRVDIKV